MALENTHYGAKEIERLLQDTEGIWFLGVGGVSMSALAEMTLQRGYRVGGSDRADSERTKRLRKMGAEIEIGERDAIPKGYGAVVYTVAISEQNLQYVYAKNAEIPRISRADYLGYLMSGYEKRIGVAGMHGKSTCTAMCAEILLRAGDPTIMAGAELPALGGESCRVGKAKDEILFEACEYMDSFLCFCPNIAVVLNIGMDHVDYFHSMQQVKDSFRRYAEIAKNGALLWNLDDGESRTVFDTCPYGKTFSAIDPTADFYAADLRTGEGRIRFTMIEKTGARYPIKCRAVGRHHVYNALAAAGAARLAGVAPETVARAMAGYQGVARRMEYRGELNGCTVYSDYAHHPDEIKATLRGARELLPKGGRLICVYQPHTYSRTKGLFDDFAKAFRDADLTLFTDIYAAREQNESGVSAEMLAKAAEQNGTHAHYTGDLKQTAQTLPTQLRAGDLILIMGAGDINTIEERLPIRKNDP